MGYKSTLLTILLCAAGIIMLCYSYFISFFALMSNVDQIFFYYFSFIRYKGEEIIEKYSYYNSQEYMSIGITLLFTFINTIALAILLLLCLVYKIVEISKDDLKIRFIKSMTKFICISILVASISLIINIVIFSIEFFNIQSSVYEKITFVNYYTLLSTCLTSLVICSIQYRYYRQVKREIRNLSKDNSDFLLF